MHNISGGLVGVGSLLHLVEGGEEFGYIQVNAIPLVKMLEDVRSLLRLHNNAAGRLVQAFAIAVYELSVPRVRFPQPL